MIVFFSRRREQELVQGILRDFQASHLVQLSRLSDVEGTLKTKPVVFLVIGRDLTFEERERAVLLGLNYGIQTGILPGLYESLLAGAKPVPIGDIPVVVFPAFTPQGKGGRKFLRRTLAGLSLLLIAPLLAGIALGIKIDSPGSVLYGQKRVGQFGQTFTLWKFRTMLPQAEDLTGPVFCQKDDSRVTCLGHFLRKSHLDELPQLYNILRGDMAWVGPRPERPVFVRSFEENIAHYPLRHLVPPGMTGEAQIHLNYEAKPEDKLPYDLQHLRRQGLMDDAKTLLATIPVILGRKGRS